MLISAWLFSHSGATKRSIQLSKAVRCRRCSYTGYPSRLTGKLRQASLMHAMPVPSIDADRSDMVQALDQTEHCRGLRRLRHLAKPDEPALLAFRPSLRQRIQLPERRVLLTHLIGARSGNAGDSRRSRDNAVFS